MSRIERFHPGTMVSDWCSGSIAANGGWAAANPETGAGYYCGGSTGSGVNYVNRLAFFRETTSALSNSLSGGAYGVGATTGTNGTAGYISLGQELAPHYVRGTVNKLIFSTESVVGMAYGLSSTKSGCAGFQNDGTAFYFSFGHSADGDKWTQPSETRSTISNMDYYNYYNLGGVSDSGSHAYSLAGYAGGVGGQDDCTKFTFSNDSRSALASVLSENAYWAEGAANHAGGKGYIAGGTAGAWLDRVVFSSDTFSSVGNDFGSGSGDIGLTTDNNVALYRMGGQSGSSDAVGKMPYSTETCAALTPTLVDAVGKGSCVENHGDTTGL